MRNVLASAQACRRGKEPAHFILERTHVRCYERGRGRCGGGLQILSLLAALGVACVSLHAAENTRLDWQQGPGCRFAQLPVPKQGRTGFSLLPPDQTGIHFTNQLSDFDAAQNRILENGSGVALGDIDGDGWCDIYLCRLGGPNALYRNLGNWRFEEITAQAGVACEGQWSTGAVFADIDGDGDLDLLVNSIGGGTRAFLNDGKGHFTEMTGTRLVRRFGSTSMALADVRANGHLDLYVANYRTTTLKDHPEGLKVEAKMVDGKIVVTPADRFIPLLPRSGGVEVLEIGERDFFYLNDGHGHFAPVSWTSGGFLDEKGNPLSAPPMDWGLSVLFRDLNGDGTPDLYVCNDFFKFPDRIWLNDAGHRFRAIDSLALRHTSLSSMAVDVADINGDGLDDIFVADMLSRHHAFRQRQRPDMMQGIIEQPITEIEARPEVPHNTLFLNRGDGTYAEIAQLSGIDASEWSWGAMFMDVDLDGYPDLLIPTGNNHDVQDADILKEISAIREPITPDSRQRNLQKFPQLITRNLLFRNRGDLTFEEVGARWGFDDLGIHQGMAAADLDNDGDLDVVINNLNGPAGIYRNESSAPRLAVRLKGRAPNTRGINAKIKVLGGPLPQSQEMICGGRYLSCDDTVRVFAAGTETNRLQIEVTWRNGRRSTVEGARPNYIYEIEETEDQRPETRDQRLKIQEPAPGAPLTTPGSVPPAPGSSLFVDVSERIGHVHYDEPISDFDRQPLLSRHLSDLGPGVAWGDLNGDGWDDLVVGSGKAGRTAVFLNNKNGGFARANEWSGTNSLERDQTTVLVLENRESSATILAGVSNYEDGAVRGAAVQAMRSNGSAQSLVAADANSAGPIALADIDGDGQLDLFVGGRCVPGRYPEAASSKIFRGNHGAFQLDEANSTLLKNVGLVSSAIFSDLDGDGLPELILACEWGPVRVFRNEHGRFREVTEALGLAQYRGWWNGVAVGDFDGDGQLDIVATNWGRNTRFQRYLKRPLAVYFGDFAGTGVVDLLDAYLDPDSNKMVAWRDFDTLSRALPFLRERIPTYRKYGQSSVQELLGPAFSQARLWEADTLDSMVFLNRHGHFEAKPLPTEAQFAPAFGVTVADFDGDGKEDIFLAQNFFGVEPETTRYDAGRGLLLRGDGNGNFSAMSGQESGIKIYGEQRGCAAADFDQDGRVDLVVAQNRAATKLYRNLNAAPGIRIRLSGPIGNPTGIGAIIRIGRRQPGSNALAWGPAREVHGGGGYWSQDSAVTVMARLASAEWIVRWPGGLTSSGAVPADAKEIKVRYPSR